MEKKERSQIRTNDIEQNLDRRHQIITCDPLLHLGLCVGKALSSPRVIKITVICLGSYLTRPEGRFAQRSYILSV